MKHTSIPPIYPPPNPTSTYASLPPTGEACCDPAAPAPLKLNELILLAIESPTASTAPLGELKLTVPWAEATMLKSLILVPVQMPLMPLLLLASLAYTRPHRRLMYQPREREVHWNA